MSAAVTERGRVRAILEAVAGHLERAAAGLAAAQSQGDEPCEGLAQAERECAEGLQLLARARYGGAR